MMPPITNYSTENYNAARQNWGVSTDENGILYVANNDGLMRYDGQRWEKFYLPNKTIIRSVFAYDDRIYTGSYEEFGYWENDGYGGLKYTSLTSLIADPINNEEFWQIVVYKEKIVFRSFTKIFIYDGINIKPFVPDFIVTSMLVDGNSMLIGSNDGGLYEFNGRNFKLLAGTRDDSIISIVQVNGVILLGTRFNGIYAFEDGYFVSWGSNALKEFLTTNELNKMITFNNDLLIVGTVKGGIAYYHIKEQKLKNHHRKNGLLNNTVLSLAVNNDQLWAGLDNGIAEIHPDAAIQYYIDYSGQLGAVYDIELYEDKIYLGSNTGVHSLDGNKLTFLKGSQGQVWNLKKLKDRLIVNHNRGIYEVKDTTLFPVTLNIGSYDLTNIPNEADRYLNPTYNGIYILKDSTDLTEEKKLENFDIPVNKVLFENNETFWASHPYNGLYRINLKNDKTQNVTNHSKDSLFSAYKTSIHKIENAITFNNDGSWYRFNALKNDIEPFPEMEGLKNYGLLNEEGKYYWFKNRKGNGIIITDFTQDSLYLIEPLLESRMISNYDKVIPVNDSIAFATMNEGFASINYKNLLLQRKEHSSPPPLLREISDTEGKHLLSEKDFSVSYNNSADFTIRVSPANPEQKLFFYELSNGSSGFLENGTLHFNKLTPGNYKISIYGIATSTNKRGEALAFSFTVLRPWYSSRVMLLVYVLLIALGVYIVYLVNKRKLNRHRKDLESKLQKEQERKSQLAEHNRLMNEIKVKKKELANTTFQAAKRNRTLIEIKNELDNITNKQENKYKIKNLKSKINHVLEGKDNWKVFEENFNEIHDDFFHDLLKDYPKLSSKDLKLCAYLKMNLSSKEIAPLMSISVRGVEIHRYRLRKKLNLDTNENLSKFLISHY